jgi:hypothetical protein
MAKRKSSVHPAIPTPHCTDIDNVLNGDGKTITIKQQFSNCDSSEQRHMTEQAECVGISESKKNK